MFNIFENFAHRILRKSNNKVGIGILEDDVRNDQLYVAGLPRLERRQEPRIQVSVPVWYQVKGHWFRWLMASSLDCSNNGIRLSIPKGIKVGDEISLKLKLPTAANPTNVDGVVVWVSPDAGENMSVECGVAFKNIRSIPNNEKLLYFMADKLCQIGIKEAARFESYPVQSIEDIEACYRMTYKSYLARGYCSPNEKEMHYSHYCLLPTSRTFVLKEKGDIAGTISLIVDTPAGLPIDSIFADELAPMRQEGRRLAEVSLLTVLDEKSGKRVFSLTNFDKQLKLFCLFKTMYEYARHIAGVTDLVICMHPKHETLYRYLQFESIGQIKSYNGANGKPARLMTLCFSQVEPIYPPTLKKFFTESLTSPEILSKRFVWSSELVHQYLVQDPDLWLKIPIKSRRFLKECYPSLTYLP